MSLYPYDFQTCGHSIIDRVRATVDSQREWDFSKSVSEARANNSEAAKRFGLKRLHKAEHKALAKYLIAKRAGLHIATYAWGTYVDLIGSSDKELATTG